MDSVYLTFQYVLYSFLQENHIFQAFFISIFKFLFCLYKEYVKSGFPTSVENPLLLIIALLLFIKQLIASHYLISSAAPAHWKMNMSNPLPPTESRPARMNSGGISHSVKMCLSHRVFPTLPGVYKPFPVQLPWLVLFFQRNVSVSLIVEI